MKKEEYNDDMVWNYINNTITCDPYDDVLTLIETIVQYWDSFLKEQRERIYFDENFGYFEEPLYQKFNNFFERECIGYRFIGEIITPISVENEICSINEAIEKADKVVKNHLIKANILLANRENLDYENSIKESISAVEALCEIITGTKGKEATLGKLLKKLEGNGIEIQVAMKEAFQSLYGYTSDAQGIRHAGDIGGPASTFEKAKFMLVSCSAFINYLMALISD